MVPILSWRQCVNSLWTKVALWHCRSLSSIFPLDFVFQKPLSVIQGGKSFNSGRPVPNNSFLYTFDEPGNYCVASQGAPGFAGNVQVMQDGKYICACIFKLKSLGVTQSIVDNNIDGSQVMSHSDDCVTFNRRLPHVGSIGYSHAGSRTFIHIRAISCVLMPLFICITRQPVSRIYGPPGSIQQFISLSNFFLFDGSHTF